MLVLPSTFRAGATLDFKRLVRPREHISLAYILVPSNTKKVRAMRTTERLIEAFVNAFEREQKKSFAHC
jgi:hypothetical protein